MCAGRRGKFSFSLAFADRMQLLRVYAYACLPRMMYSGPVISTGSAGWNSVQIVSLSPKINPIPSVVFPGDSRRVSTIVHDTVTM